jgi:hypothetical protein
VEEVDDFSKKDIFGDLNEALTRKPKKNSRNSKFFMLKRDAGHMSLRSPTGDTSKYAWSNSNGGGDEKRGNGKSVMLLPPTSNL